MIKNKSASLPRNFFVENLGGRKQYKEEEEEKVKKKKRKVASFSR